MGGKTLSDGYNTFMDTLLLEGKIEQRVFSFYLESGKLY
jgi:hypothetical protein